MKNQKGSTLIEVIIALALLGIVGVTFLHALGTTSSSRTVSNEHTAGRIIASSQMDVILTEPYASSYASVPLSPEYSGYIAAINIANLYDGNIQKITVTVTHNAKQVTKLESYKVIR